MKEKSVAGKIAYAALLVALSMIFGYVEALIPIAAGLPGVKIGLANLVVLTGLYFLPVGEVFLISMARIFLTAFLFGNMSSLIYSLAGGLFSFAVMCGGRRLQRFTMTGVSILGGVGHNMAQLLVAALVVGEWKILSYLTFLLPIGAVTGVLIGMLGQRCLPFLKKFFPPDGTHKDIPR